MKKQVTLGVEGLTELEAYLTQYEKAIQTTRKKIVEDLCETGESLLAEYSPIEDHELKSSTTHRVSHQGRVSRGEIYQTAPHAPFVEFGTGVVGKSNPHKEYQSYDWTYDTNSHGDDGWYYYDTDRGTVRWTKGQVASAQHLKTAVDLRSVVKKVAKERLQKEVKS